MKVAALKIFDPFSRYQPCEDLGINGWSRLTDLGRFEWGNANISIAA